MNTPGGWGIPMSRNYIFKVTGGGVFSRLLQCAITPLADIEFDSVYLTLAETDLSIVENDNLDWLREPFMAQISVLREYGIENAYDLPLNYILTQRSDPSFEDGGVLPVGMFHSARNPIEYSPRLPRYKQVLNKIHIRPGILYQAQKIFGDTDPSKVLGVHVRLKDIDGHHYDQVTFDMYRRAIDQTLASDNFAKIFVAADNHSSLARLQDIYKDQILSFDADRAEDERNDFSKWEFANYFKKSYWWGAMVDCLGLAQCSSLICRNSNFSNAAILFGNHRLIQRLS